MGAKSQMTVDGYWEDGKISWYEQQMFYCGACGILLPKRQFIVEVDSVCHRFCGPDCAKLSEQLEQLNKP